MEFYTYHLEGRKSKHGPEESPINKLVDKIDRVRLNLDKHPQKH